MAKWIHYPAHNLKIVQVHWLSRQKYILQILKFPQKICGQKAGEVFQTEMGLEERSIFPKWLKKYKLLGVFLFGWFALFFFLDKMITFYRFQIKFHALSLVNYRSGHTSDTPVCFSSGLFWVQAEVCYLASIVLHNWSSLL